MHVRRSTPTQGGTGGIYTGWYTQGILGGAYREAYTTQEAQEGYIPPREAQEGGFKPVLYPRRALFREVYACFTPQGGPLSEVLSLFYTSGCPFWKDFKPVLYLRVSLLGDFKPVLYLRVSHLRSLSLVYTSGCPSERFKPGLYSGCTSLPVCVQRGIPLSPVCTTVGIPLFPMYSGGYTPLFPMYPGGYTPLSYRGYTQGVPLSYRGYPSWYVTPVGIPPGM